MTKVYFDIEGEPVPADECTWVYIAPCGCECAWALAGEYGATAGQAWENFARTKAARQRDVKLGFRVDIKRHRDIDIASTCPHTPRFGVPPRPELDGHTWAVKHEGRVLHLVPLVIERDSYVITKRSERVSPVCRRVEGDLWSTERHEVDGLAECTACLKVAAEVAEGVASGCSAGPARLPNGKCDKDIRDIGVALLLGNSRTIEDGPDRCGNTKMPGPDHALPLKEECEAAIILPSLAGLTVSERRDCLIGLLDDIRKAYDSTRIMRIELMIAARENDLSCHDIGVVLGITENAVRAQIKRAQASGVEVLSGA